MTIEEKMTELKAKVNEFEKYLKKFKKTKYDYHCEIGVEGLYHELSQLKDWLDVRY